MKAAYFYKAMVPDLGWMSDSACMGCGTEFNAQGQQFAPRDQRES